LFGIFAPITYNTDLRSLFGGYYSSFYTGYSPFALPFQRVIPYYGGMNMTYQYINNYQFSNYPSMFAMNYASPVYSSGGYSTGVSSSVPVVSSSSHKAVTNSVKTSSASSSQVHKRSDYSSSDNNTLAQEFIKVARKYSNCAEYDNSHLKFCINPTCRYEDPRSEEWCTDFVTYVVKEAYRNKGKTPPVGFGDHDVKTMKKWAIDNGYFIRTSNKSRKGKFIVQNIKPGDIMVINENKYSHIGFVTRIDSNGVIHTIEGNRDDRVKEYSYSPNYPNLSGFIRLTF